MNCLIAVERLDQIVSHYYEEDMAEEGREGDEMTGDDHSAGLQGEETEIKGQRHIHTGLPGELNEDNLENLTVVQGKKIAS